MNLLITQRFQIGYNLQEEKGSPFHWIGYHSEVERKEVLYRHSSPRDVDLLSTPKHRDMCYTKCDNHDNSRDCIVLLARIEKTSYSPTVISCVESEIV